MKEKETIAISPISNSYLTNGKEYKIVSLTDNYFCIIDDKNHTLHCRKNGCPHLNYNNWTLK